MPGKQTFEQKLQSHVGGLIRVRYSFGGTIGLNGKIGLLMSASDGFPAGGPNSVVVEVLIEERVRSILLYSHELEFIRADDAK